jgi:hypothetical protein
VPSEPVTDIAALFAIFQGGVVFHCLYAVTRLGLPDRLEQGPRSVAELAAEVKADEDALRRVLRLLAGHGIVEMDGERVQLTPATRLLCGGHPMSLAATFSTVGFHDVAHKLTETLRTGRAAARPALGMEFWDHLRRRPEEQELFTQGMSEQARLLSLPCVELLDWPAGGTVADVAGGSGVLLARVLREAPGLRGILVEQPQVLRMAEPVLAAYGVAGRCVLHAGDLFSEPPPADLYLLSRVLHDWNDEEVVRILRVLAAGAGPGARLRVFEDLLPETGLPAPIQCWSDVVMMALYDGARERTLPEYQTLLDTAGWRFERAVTGPPGMNVIEAVLGSS